MKQSRIRFLVTALVLILAVVLSACGGAAPAAAPGGAPATEAPAGEAAAAPAGEKTVIVGFYQEPENLNPLIATQTVANEVMRMVLEGLVMAGPDGRYFAQLASEVPTMENGLVSEDGLTVTYPLREGVLWSDGEPFTCDDVVYTWEVATNPESQAVNTTGFDEIESITCPDDNTVVVQYSEFFGPYLSTFRYNILPRHATGDPADMPNWDWNLAGIVGTGPFTVKEWNFGDQIILAANENYRDYPELPHVNQIIGRIIPSREVGKALITSGEIDVLWDLTEADVPEFEENPDVNVYNQPGLGTERLVVNLADPTLDATDDPVNNPHPLLGDLRVRQAIELGIDKQFLVDELLYGATTVGTSELNQGWAECDIPPSEYSPEAAEALLEEAGFTDQDGDGVRECHGCLYAEEGTPLSLTYQTTSGNQLREESQQLVLEMMADIGIELNIQNVPSSELFGSWSSGAFRKHGQFDILMYTTSETADPQSQMNDYFSADRIPTEANNGTGTNYSRWINDAATDAIAAAATTSNLDERAAYYQTACEQITAELPHIYLYDRGEIHLARNNVSGFVVNVFENSMTWNAQEWDIE